MIPYWSAVWLPQTLKELSTYRMYTFCFCTNYINSKENANFIEHYYLMSHNNATPRKTQNSGGLIVCSHNGVISSTYVLCGFL